MRNILSLLTFCIIGLSASRSFSANLEKPKVIPPGKPTSLPTCQGNLGTKLRTCEKYKCAQDMIMGLKSEFFIHGFSSNQKDCQISTPNQRLTLSKENLLRLASYYTGLDQGQEIPDENFLSGQKTYKFKDFSCKVSTEDIYDTTGMQEAKGQCKDISMINGKGYCTSSKQVMIKYTKVTLVDKKPDPKCKNIDFGIFEDFYKKGLISNMQAEIQK